MLHIALVDDSPADSQMMQMALEQTGAAIEVTVLEDGARAMEYLTGTGCKGPAGCDLVLLDLNLPRVSGYEVLEQIRACEKLSGLPVIILSGSSDEWDVERCYEAGANSYIVKPTHLTDILLAATQFVDYWSRCVKLPPQRRIVAVQKIENSF